MPESTPQCPVCQTALTDDFGIVECPKCKTPLSINFDGSVEKMSSEPEIIEQNSETFAGVAPANEAGIILDATDEPPVVADPDATVFNTKPFSIDDMDLPESPYAQHTEDGDAPAEDLINPESPFLNLAAQLDQPVDESSFRAGVIDESVLETNFSEEPAPQPVDAEEEEPFSDFSAEEPVAEPAEETSEAAAPNGDYEDLENFDEAASSSPSFATPVANSSPDLSDLSSFANSSESGGPGGSLRYNVIVSGIDTADIRSEFRDLITDKKFLWDPDALLKSIRAGTVRVDNLTAVKALLFIQRLRELPVEVMWEQNAIHQA